MNITLNINTQGINQGMRMRGMHGGGGSPPSATDLLKKLDQDGTGTLSQSEVKGPLENQFSTADTNSDGQLNTEELQKAMESLHAEMKNRMGNFGQEGFKAPSAADLIQSMDDDGNGTINKSEAKGILAKRFDAADTNKDGVVTQDELTQDISTFQAEHPAPARSSSALSDMDTADSGSNTIDLSIMLQLNNYSNVMQIDAGNNDNQTLRLELFA